MLVMKWVLQEPLVQLELLALSLCSQVFERVVGQPAESMDFLVQLYSEPVLLAELEMA
jgi:hypothetical protein